MDKHQRGPITSCAQQDHPMAIHFWICLYPHHSPIFTSTLGFIPTLCFPQFTHSSPILKTLQRMAANTLMSSAVTAFPSLLSSSKSRFASSVPISSFGTNVSSSRFSMTADWMPGQPRPPYLDGSAPGYATYSHPFLFSTIISTLNMFFFFF